MVVNLVLACMVVSRYSHRIGGTELHVAYWRAFMSRQRLP